MRVKPRSTEGATLADLVRADLRRPHPVAYERMGFLKAHAGLLDDGGIILLPFDYLAVDDAAYIRDPRVGARVSDAGFRPARQAALTEKVCIVHVHLHEHVGRPGFSRTDSAESAQFMPDFLKVAPKLPHGALILSADSAIGRCWNVGPMVAPMEQITFVGTPIVKVRYA